MTIKPPMTWAQRFVFFTIYMRQLGWRRPFMMTGNVFHIIGMCRPADAHEWGDNDNRAPNI